MKRVVFKREEKSKELKEIEKGLNWKEKIIVHINKKTFIKVYNNTRIEIINKILH